MDCGGFRTCGVNCEAAARPKSELYTDLLPLINSGAVRLLDNPRLVAQLVSLERDTTRSGKDRLITPRASTTTSVNCCAGALTMSAEGPYISAWQRQAQTRRIKEAMARGARSLAYGVPLPARHTPIFLPMRTRASACGSRCWAKLGPTRSTALAARALNAAKP